MIYLDHASLTPVVPSAMEAMQRAIADAWGNPESTHAAGRRARSALAEAQIHVAAYLGCAPYEIEWHTRGTDALTSALARAARATSGAIVSSSIEHPSVQRAASAWSDQGRDVRWLPAPGGELVVDAAAALLEGASVVVLSAMNHELGTTFPLARLMELAPEAYWVIDAVQAAAWSDVDALMRDRVFLVASSAKLGGPPGAAVLRVPATLRSKQEPESTSNWLNAIGMGACCAWRRLHRNRLREQVMARCSRLLEGIQSLPHACVHNRGREWGGTMVNVSFPGIDARALETQLDLAGVCIARGSACLQRKNVPSPVVSHAFSDEPWRAASATRWSPGAETTEQEIDEALAVLAGVMSRLDTSRDGGVSR